MTTIYPSGLLKEYLEAHELNEPAYDVDPERLAAHRGEVASQHAGVSDEEREAKACFRAIVEQYGPADTPANGNTRPAEVIAAKRMGEVHAAVKKTIPELLAKLEAQSAQSKAENQAILDALKAGFSGIAVAADERWELDRQEHRRERACDVIYRTEERRDFRKFAWAVVILLALIAGFSIKANAQVDVVTYQESGTNKAVFAAPHKVNFTSGCALTKTGSTIGISCSGVAAGSGTELQYRNGGAFAGVSGSSVSGANITLGGSLTTGGTKLNSYTATPYKFLELPHANADGYLGPALKAGGTLFCFPNTAGGSVTANCVMRIGQNMTAGGAREDTSYGSVYWSLEPYYEPSAGLFAQEAHLEYLNNAGVSHRAITTYSDTAGTTNIGFVNDYAYFANEAGTVQAYIGNSSRFDWYMGTAAADSALVPVLRVPDNAALATDARIEYQKGTTQAASYWRIGQSVNVSDNDGFVGIGSTPVADVKLRMNAQGDDGIDIAGATPPPNYYLRARDGSTTFFSVSNTGAVSAANAPSFQVPTSAGAAPATNGFIAYDSTAHQFEGGVNSANKVFAMTDGNIATATALAANGSNCSAGSYARGVDASGAAENCTADLGYVIHVTYETGGFNPLDATSYCLGMPLNNRQATCTGVTYDRVKFKMPVACTATRVYYKSIVQGTLSSAEDATFAIRLNDTSDFGATTTQIDMSAAFQDALVTVSQAIAEGDYIALKVTTPTWVTNPTSAIWSAYIYCA